MAQENNPDNVGLFKTENLLKASIFLAGLFVQGVLIFNNVKAEIHDNKVLDTADKLVINFRLAQLEQNVGILPKEPKIEQGK